MNIWQAVKFTLLTSWRVNKKLFLLYAFIQTILALTFIIDLLRGKNDAVKFANGIESELVKVTSITVFEIFKGIKRKDQIEKIGILFDNLIILNLDRKSAELAGELFRELKEKGQEIDPEDCMIAAIAILNNDKLITKNTGHFGRIKKLNINSY